LKLHHALELLLLAALWGASFLFIRIGSPEFNPIPFMMLRCLLAGLVLLPLIIFSKHRLQLLSHRWKISVVGIWGTAIPFVLYAYAALALNAGVISILNATIAMFTAVIAYFWLKENLNKTSIAGLLLGFIGVTILTLDKTAGDKTNSILASLAVLVAACCAAGATTYTKRYLSGVSPLISTGGSQLIAAVALMPLAYMYWPASTPSVEAIVSLILLAIFSTALATILFFSLINSVGPAKAVSVAYLVPVFGLLWGMIFLDEKITSNIIIGAVLVLCGLGLITGLFTRFFTKKLPQKS
jgi:drug/metabolite transporter (DMT)-like permease